MVSQQPLIELIIQSFYYSLGEHIPCSVYVRVTNLSLDRYSLLLEAWASRARLDAVIPSLYIYYYVLFCFLLYSDIHLITDQLVEFRA